MRIESIIYVAIQMYLTEIAYEKLLNAHLPNYYASYY